MKGTASTPDRAAGSERMISQVASAATPNSINSRMRLESPSGGALGHLVIIVQESQQAVSSAVTSSAIQT